MRLSSQEIWFRRAMTSMVILGIMLASDARLTHLVSCTKAADLCAAAEQVDKEALPDCCPGSVAPELGSQAAGVDVCLEQDNCGCCSHGSNQHLGEFDGRALLKTDPPEFDGFTATLSAPLSPAAASAPARVLPTTADPLPAAPIFLLLGHLRF